MRFDSCCPSLRPSFAWMIVLATVLPDRVVPAQNAKRVLSPRNVEAPFCYLRGRSRRWSIAVPTTDDRTRLDLAVIRQNKVVVNGPKVQWQGLRISVGRAGKLVVAADKETSEEIQLEITVHRDGQQQQSQRIEIRPAPPDRPLSYVADLVDDLIRIYWDPATRRFRPFEKDGFDQYFRRLQSQGIKRLIVWQSAFPLMVDRSNYADVDWRRFAGQARAILDHQPLNESMRATAALKSYQWLGMLMRLRLDRDFGRMLTSSAIEHGIKLTASFRPFEAALTKYYEVPAFDHQGRWLWGFLPGASPAVNYHPDQVSFANYRQILLCQGRVAESQLKTIEIQGVEIPDAVARRFDQPMHDLQLLAAPVPPLDESSYVLLKHIDESFRLVQYAAVRDRVEAQWIPVAGAKFGKTDDGLMIEFDPSSVPSSHCFLLLRSTGRDADRLELPVVPRVTLRSMAGNRLGRINVYAALNGTSTDERQTRVAGILPNGLFRTEFQAIENSIDYFRKSGQATWRLATGTLVINRGANWSVEMTDFNRAAAREFVVKELRTILANAAFDEIFVNTRSHTQLSASTADGVDGIQPMAHYRLQGKNYFHYGIDRAYGPIDMAANRLLREVNVEQISTWQTGEWQRPCQTPETPFVWRYCRNQAIAEGVRALLVDFERAFPGTRIRAVIPESQSVLEQTEAALRKMPQPNAGTYGADYYRHIRGSLNHIPAIGEGMTLVDLSGLSVEPVFLGVRFAPDPQPFTTFVNACVDDLRDNRGSSYRGAKSFFYEAQETLRGQNAVTQRARREAIICELLRRPEIGEVLLYEAADWTYNLPSSDRKLNTHGYLDECQSKGR